LQRLYSIIDKQMEETSQIFNISNVSKDKESLDGTSTHATCYGMHDFNIYILSNFISHDINTSLNSNSRRYY